MHVSPWEVHRKGVEAQAHFFLGGGSIEPTRFSAVCECEAFPELQLWRVTKAHSAALTFCDFREERCRPSR